MIASPYSRWSDASTRAPKKLAVSCSKGSASALLCGRAKRPVEGSRTHLEAVADSEDGDAGVKDGGVDARSVLLVDRERRARQDDACESEVGASGQLVDSASMKVGRASGGERERTLGLPLEVGELLSARKHLAVDVELAASAHDQVRVLRACEVGS